MIEKNSVSQIDWDSFYWTRDKVVMIAHPDGNEFNYVMTLSLPKGKII